MKCTRVEPWIAATYTVQFVGDKEPSTKPILEYRPCKEDAVVREQLEGYVVHHCAGHARPVTL